MRILNTNAGLITNFEVHKTLEDQKARNKGTKRATKDMIFVEKQIGHYLHHHSLVKRQTVESIQNFLTASAVFELSHAEQLQIVNLCPTTLVEVYLAVDDIETRMGNERATELLEMIMSTLYVEVEEVQKVETQQSLFKKVDQAGGRSQKGKNGHGKPGRGKSGRGGRGGSRNGRS